MSDRTVLVVDDDESIREVAALSLEIYAGWTILCAEGGADAIEIAQTRPVDAILLDFMMPDMDGLTTFHHLQADASTSEIPVILVTAKSRVGPTQPWDDTGIRGMIAKPFDARTLAQEVATMLHWHDFVPRRR